MNYFASFILVSVVVGIVTAGLKIQFDRFFVIILLITILKMSVFAAVNIFLWIVLLSTLYIIGKNWSKIKALPQESKKKFITLVPVLAFIGTFFGSWFFRISSGKALGVTIGILALLYGLRLIFLHFAQHELNYLNEKPFFQKICGLFGPVISGFFNGFVGTTLKPLKLPFAIKLGKMNMDQVYLGNTISAFYASFFSIILHSFMPVRIAMNLTDVYWGVGLWLAIHSVYELTYPLFKNHWRKGFQIIVGIVLILVSFKFI